MANSMTGMDRSILSDLHKDARGFRPGLEFWNSVERMSDDEVNSLFAGLQEEVDQELVWERERNLRAQKTLEQDIQKMQDLGAADRQTALRWLLDGSEIDQSCHQDVEHFFWDRGIAMDFWPHYMTECGFARKGMIWIKEAA